MAEGLKKLLGDSLKLKDATVETASFVGSKVGLYFSAHWCPPCRGFTPKLVEFYNKYRECPNKDKMEIIFVSSDRDESSFDEYYAEMPWHCLPYSDRDRKATLSKKFQVGGIPSLVVVDADSGEVITKNGRAMVTEDAEGKDFPWYPKSIADLLEGPLTTKDGIKDHKHLDDKIVGIYFSAHWCPPCRNFTPELIKCYNKLKEDGKNFEIVFVSWDRDSDAFEEYYKDMPWTTIPLDDPRVKELGGHFEVEGIPSLVLLDEQRRTISKNGRGAVSSDPEGKEFPWNPKPLCKLTSMGAGAINEAAALIYLSVDPDDDKEQKAESAMKAVAEKYFADRKENTDMDELNFFYECKDSDDLPDSLRGFANLGENPLLLLLNIPDQEKYVVECDDLTPAQVEDVVSKFKAGTLECKPLRG